MSKKVKKIISAGTAALMVFGLVGYTVINSDEKVISADNDETKKTIESVINENVKFTTTGEDKEETVYVLSDAEGNVTKTIVSDWLKNKDGSTVISDKSDLNNIENVKSDASFTKDKDNKIVWNANGEDIYYQGETDKKLPVDVKITYLLDGKEMSAKEIAGKSGKVTIRFDYTNNESREVTVNGVKTQMYVPFTMISGMVLDGNSYSNVEVSSGKVISDGSKYIVVGLAFPGMNDNLNLGKVFNNDKNEEKLSFPETVEVTADVKDFSLALTLTMGSADLISQVNADDVNAADDLKTVLDSLTSATEELQSGTNQLQDGVSELKNNFVSYAQGINKMTSGIGDINNAVGQLKEKMGTFSDGLFTALNGIDTIISELSGEGGAVSGANQLADGASKVDAGVDSLKQNAGVLSDAVGKLAAGSKSVDDNLNMALSAFKDKSPAEPGLTSGSQAVADGVTELQAQLLAMVNTMNEKINANNSQMEMINAVLSSGKNPQTGADLTAGEIAYYQAALQQLTGANTALQEMLKGMNPETMNQSLTNLSNGASAVAGGVSKLEQGLTQIETEGTTVLTSGCNELDSKVPALVSGIDELKAGTSQVSQGAAALAQGIVKLNNAIATNLRPGIDTLYQGGLLFKTSVNKLYEGTNTAASSGTKLNAATDKVTDGIGTLYDGSVKLNNGMTQFKEEGIDKAADFAENELAELAERVKFVVKLANDYTIYSMAEDGKSTSVKFIYETEGINK